MGWSESVFKSKAIAAPATVVWKTLTLSSLVEQWLPIPEVSMQIVSDWQVGATILFNGVWHGRPYQDKGIIICCDEAALLRYRYWTEMSELPDRLHNYTTVEFRLLPATMGTNLELRHSGLMSYEMYGHANFYWTHAMERIKRVAETISGLGTQSGS